MESFLRKFKKIAVVLSVLYLLTGMYGMTNIQKAYVNNEFVGYVDDKIKVKELYKEIVDDVSNKFSEVDLGRNNIKFEDTNQLHELTDLSQLKNNLIKAVDIDVDAFTMSIDDVNIGYIDTFKVGEEVIDTLKKQAIEKNTVEEDKLLSVEIQGEVSYNKEKVKLADVKDASGILENIKEINQLRDDKVAVVEILELKREIEDIEQDTKVMATNNLYLGQEMALNGEVGKKEVKKKNVYVDGEIVKSTVLEENLLYKPKDNIIYKGVENPIKGGVVFLGYPSDSRIITSMFGKRWGNENHRGVDIDGRTGQEIRAAFEGTVKFAGWMNGYGNTIIIDHGSSIETLYAHASKLTAKIGDKVNKGDKVAEVGSTGRSTGPHIHFELRNNGVQVNPLNYMK